MHGVWRTLRALREILILQVQPRLFALVQSGYNRRHVKKQRSYTDQTVEEIEYTGHGIIKPEGRVVFVEGVLPGEVVDVAITRQKRSHAFARVTAWHAQSDERREPFCSHFADCGGCTWQYLPYEGQLRYKERLAISGSPCPCPSSDATETPTTGTSWTSPLRRFVGSLKKKWTPARR